MYGISNIVGPHEIIFALLQFLRYMPFFKITIFEPETRRLTKVPENAYVLYFEMFELILALPATVSHIEQV